MPRKIILRVVAAAVACLGLPPSAMAIAPMKICSIFTPEYCGGTSGYIHFQDEVTVAAQGPSLIDLYFSAQNPGQVARYIRGLTPSERDALFCEAHPSSRRCGGETDLAVTDPGLACAMAGGVYEPTSGACNPTDAGSQQVPVMRRAPCALRSQDYYQGSAAITIPNPVTSIFLSLAGHISVDRYGQVYVGAGPSVGLNVPGAASVVGGRLSRSGTYATSEGFNTVQYNVDPGAMRSFMTGPSLSVTTGAGFAWGNASALSTGRLAEEGGLGFPQVGVTLQYSGRIGSLPLTWGDCK